MQYMSVLADVPSVLAYVPSVLAVKVVCTAGTCRIAVAADTGQSACKSIACRSAICAKMLLSNPWQVASTVSDLTTAGVFTKL